MIEIEIEDMRVAVIMIVVIKSSQVAGVTQRMMIRIIINNELLLLRRLHINNQIEIEILLLRLLIITEKVITEGLLLHHLIINKLSSPMIVIFSKIINNKHKKGVLKNNRISNCVGVIFPPR